MRYGIFSDVHSNLEALEVVINAYQDESIDRYLCAGDIVGYAANPNECIEKTKMLAVDNIAGNHDWASVDLFSANYFNPAAYEAISWTKRNLKESNRYFLESLKLIYKNEHLTLVHGTLNSPEDFNYMSDGETAEDSFSLLGTDICFIGHTHVFGVFIKGKDGRMYYLQENSIYLEEGNRYIINVGSIGQPRDGNPAASYCIYDTDKKEVQIKRIDYDIKTARQKIINAGLPRFLGDRLLVGR